MGKSFRLTILLLAGVFALVFAACGESGSAPVNEVVRTVEVEKPVTVEVEKPVIQEVIRTVEVEKPVEIEIVREVPVEIVKEVEVVRETQMLPPLVIGHLNARSPARSPTSACRTARPLTWPPPTSTAPGVSVAGPSSSSAATRA